MKNKQNLYLLLILLVAFFMRLFRLTREDFWLDEMYVMIESTPHLPLHQLFNDLRTVELHPPLFYLCERLFLFLFGESEFTGRILPVIAGTASVWAMYLLGKEILNKNLGLIAAAFTCVNYYNLHYSREARGYIFAFLFTALSFVFLIRLIRKMRVRDSWYYSLFALLTMYSHYYGLIVIGAQFCVAFVMLCFPANRRAYLVRFLHSGLIIVIGYIPWIPFVLKMSSIPSFWTGAPTEDFIFTYFNGYFGNSGFLEIILVLLLIYYVMNVFRSEGQPLTELAGNSLQLSFIVFTVSLVMTYTIPYVRSILGVPMLWFRYTIVALPVLLVAVAYGAELISSAVMKGVVFWTFIGWSLVHICVTDGLYTRLHNPQDREMTAFMVSDPKDMHYPVIDEKDYNWHQSYYLDQFHYPGPVIHGSLSGVMESILNERSPGYRVDGFWLVSANSTQNPDSIFRPKNKVALDSSFSVAKEGRWFGAWARLYLSKRIFSKLTLTTDDFSESMVVDRGEKVVAIWGGEVTSNRVSLSQGDYTVHILAKGTPAKNVFPHVIVAVNHQRIGDYYVTDSLQDQELRFRQTGADTARVTIGFDNDLADEEKHQDRNLFLQRISFDKTLPH
jgi:hypothetical protein